MRYAVRFTAPEFTSLCPVTGQPDFAHLVVDYLPGDWLVESKSLKLYLISFRNHDAFHEDCTVSIGRRLTELLEPQWLRIGGYWYPRGGIPIDVFYQTGPAPEDRSEEHTSELQSLMRISYAVFCLKKKKTSIQH